MSLFCITRNSEKYDARIFWKSDLYGRESIGPIDKMLGDQKHMSLTRCVVLLQTPVSLMRSQCNHLS